MQSIFSPALTTIQPVATRLFASAQSSGRMAHAFLLTGRDQASKWLLARQLAIYLNCEKPEKAELGPCLMVGAGHSSGRLEEEVLATDELLNNQAVFSRACQNCRWLYRDTHPKAWYVLSNESGASGKIPVEKARQLSEELSLTTSYVRVVVVDDASESAFHRPAANALLKTIEEPRSNCLFLFFANAVDDVLATIVSRCQVVPLLNSRAENLGILAHVGLLPARKLEAQDEAANKAFWESAVVKELAGETFLSEADRHHGARLAQDALALAHKLHELLEEEHAPEEVFDALLALELRRIKTGKAANLARYAGTLVALTEEAKRRVDQYVGKKAVCESFVLSWQQLRQKNFI